jgi:geranylgeranyl pyrophosphate synthase
MHFQLADDCLDYETSTENMGKQTSKDLAEGVVTLPLILAMMQNPGLRQVVSRSDLSPTEIASVTAQVVADGFARNARQVAERYVTRARRSLARVSGPIRRERLDQLLVTIVSRSF